MENADAPSPPAPPAIAPALVLAAAACSGMSVMIVEMTAVRALQPFFGSTTFVWTNVIAVVMAALALGYEVGGRLADRRGTPGLLFGLMGVAGLLVVAGARFVPAVAGLFLEEGVDLGGLLTVLVKGSLGTSLLLFAPPLFFLGMVSPVAVRLLAARGLGRAAGRVFAVSTVGSILGTYLPNLVLVPWLGSRGTLAAAGVVLLLPGAVALVRARGTRGVLVCLAVSSFVLPSCLHVAGSRLRPPPRFPGGPRSDLLAERESPYQYLAVRSDLWPGERPQTVLCINEGTFSYHAVKVEGRVLTESRPYDDYSLIPFLLDVPAGGELRAAVLGYACGVDAGQWEHFWGGVYRLRVSGAELDPEVLALGREFFGARPGAGVVAADGRPWLEALPDGEVFDFLVVDAFARELYVPFHLATREFFEACRARLAPGGVLAMNVYAVGTGAPHLSALENTMATVFGSCVRASQHGGANFLLMARNGEGDLDLSRLGRGAAKARFGERSGTAEWERLLDHGAVLAGDAVVVRAREGGVVLTDDDAPLEWLTDRFLRENEAAVLARGGERVEALRDLDRRQTWMLGGVVAVLAMGGAGGWVAGRWLLRG